MLGLDPLEQDILDLTNEVAGNMFFYFPDFSHVVHRKYREEDEDLFRQNTFKVEAANESLQVVNFAKSKKISRQRSINCKLT